jgi:hypothetical protein
MNTHIIPDLSSIVISYMDTETYKKLKNIYPNEFKDAKIEEMNLFCNVSYDFLLKVVKHYTQITELAKLNFPNSKINTEDLIVFTQFSVHDDLEEKINKYERRYNSEKFFKTLFENRHILSGKYNAFITDNYGDDEYVTKFMLQIRQKILKEEINIYETTDPYNYIDVIAKYMELKLTELGY